MCELPVCFKCTGHENHRLVNTQKSYETKRQQCERIFDNIRSEVLISRYYLLSNIKADIKKCQNKFSEYHLAMLRRAQIDNIPSSFYFKHRYLRQIKKMICHIARIQTYDNNFEHFTTVKLLLPAKKINILQIKRNRYIVYHNNLSMTESLVKKDAIIFLSGIHTTEGEIRKVRNENLLKLMPGGPDLHNILTIKNDSTFCHISFLTTDRQWVNGAKARLH